MVPDQREKGVGPLKNPAWLELANEVSCQRAPSMEILRQRGEDVLIARVQTNEGQSVIVKCWNRRGLRGALRRWSRSNIGWREYTALLRLHEAGIPCPEPFAYLELPHNEARHTEALLSLDLGPCDDATEFYKTLLVTDPEAASAFETHVLDATVTMIRLGLLDPDHRLPNFVIPEDRIPVRIDFELCIPVRYPSRHPVLLGQMLGTLMGSMVFAVQPDTKRAEAFAEKLIQVMPFPLSIKCRRVAADIVTHMLERQNQEIGLKTELNLMEITGWM
jgi:hypothetical protein